MKGLHTCIWQLLFSFLILSIASCNTTESPKEELKGNIIKFAKNLKVFPTDEGYKLEIINPDTKKRYKYFLCSNGNHSIPGYETIHIPIKGITVLSASHVGMLSKIDMIDKVKGVSNAKYVYNSQLKKQLLNGLTTAFGNEQSLSTEAIIKSKSDLVIHSGFSPEFTQEEQLKKLGILCIPNFEWKETHPLGKAEWIKFFGLLFNKMNASTKYFSEIEQEYSKLSDAAKKYISKPTVFAGNIFGDYWYTPAGNSFQAQLYADASAAYVYSDVKGVGSLAISLERIIKENRNTEIWLDPGNSSLDAILKTHASINHLKAYQTKRIFDYSHNMNKYWELSASEPHHVLSDLIQIFHAAPLDTNLLYFYKKLD